MITKSIPNIFTLGNLFLGIMSMILVFHEQPGLAATMIIIAMLLDGLDGKLARALNAQSEFGKELDSLSDVVSFGVAPAFLMYIVAFQHYPSAAAWLITAIFPMCGAVRLARFNVVEGTPGYFTGLPIPIAGGILCTMALFHGEIATWIFLISSMILSYLMVSRIKYPNFKRAKFTKRHLVILSAFLIVIAGTSIYAPHMIKLLFIPFLLYAVYGMKKKIAVLLRFLRKKSKKSANEINSTAKKRL